VLGADQQVGLADQAARGDREPVEAVVADADDMDFGFDGRCALSTGIRCDSMAKAATAEVWRPRGGEFDVEGDRGEIPP
jgi:hypothetical protein